MTSSWGGISVLLVVLLVFSAAAVAKSGGRPGTKGTYDVVFAGSFRGSGTAKLNTSHLTLNAELEGNPGPGGKLDVPKLQVNDGRFDGVGTLDLQSVQVSGRVDAPEGGIVLVARIVLTVQTSDGRVARGFGELQ